MFLQFRKLKLFIFFMKNARWTDIQEILASVCLRRYQETYTADNGTSIE